MDYIKAFLIGGIILVFIMVASCVARTLDTDVGKTLMDMEMLKFLRARTSATCYHRH